MEIGEAPVFTVLSTGLIALRVLVTFAPGLSLGQLLILVQVLNGVLLPILLLFTIRLASDRELMGSVVSGPINRAIAVLTASIITPLSVLVLVITALGWFGVNLTGGS